MTTLLVMRPAGFTGCCIAGAFFTPDEVFRDFAVNGFVADGFVKDGHAQVVKMKMPDESRRY